MHKFTPNDLSQINFWFEKRKMPVPPAWIFSDQGFVVHGIAAGFVYFTNSGVAHLDCYISNPDTTREQRKAAIKEITEQLILSAKAFGHVKMVCCNTKVDSIAHMAESLGFKYDGKHLMYSKGI